MRHLDRRAMSRSARRAVGVAAALTLASAAGLPAVGGGVAQAARAAVPPLLLDPSTLTVPAGGQVAVRLLLTANYTAPIRYSVTGLPPGSGATIVTLTARERRLTISVPANAAPGLYRARLVTLNPGVRRSDTVNVLVAGAVPSTPPPTTPSPPVPSPVPVPTVAAPPPRPQAPGESIAMQVASGGIVGAGRSAPIGEVEAIVSNGTGPAVLTADGLPAGIAVTFPQNPVNGRSPIVATVASNIPSGSYSFVIVARSNRVTASLLAIVRVVDGPGSSLRLQVTPVAAVPGEGLSFGLAANVSAVSVARGSAVQLLVSVTPRGGFARAIELSTSGLPAGVVARLDPSEVANVAVLTVTVPANQPVSVSTMQIQGTSEVLRAVIGVVLTVV